MNHRARPCLALAVYGRFLVLGMLGMNSSHAALMSTSLGAPDRAMRDCIIIDRFPCPPPCGTRHVQYLMVMPNDGAYSTSVRRMREPGIGSFSGDVISPSIGSAQLCT